ncbi:MAG: VTT domain-containing protein [Methanobacteriaceae archaeon]|nr:VTT domain-containing protein [Methanobacteriaceae archaeon]MDP2837614.1 VTT domain-containing protein [Methanobacteriaceae archaeon]MDP3485750.1 VTT domain-containing protein [Methanobacteriaceae archaeon]
MLAELTTLIQNFIINYGSLGIFIASILEQIIAPIPSTAVIMGSSFFIMGNSPVSLFSLEKLFLFIALPVAFGVTIGALIIYGVVYKIGKPFVDRWGKFIGLSWEEIEKTEEKYSKSNSLLLFLFITWAVPIFPSVVISAFCGFIKFDIKKYIYVTFLGTLVKAFVLGFVAWQFGSLYSSLGPKMGISEDLVLIGLIIALIVIIIYKKRKK